MTRYQQDIERAAQELAAKHIATGESDPIGRASIEASIIRDEMKQDGVRAAATFYGKVSDRLMTMAIEADRNGTHKMLRMSDLTR